MGFIRVFLALSVVFHHIPNAPMRWVHAGIAVILFYIVSGFYMALILNEKYTASPPFYKARILRLFPGYLAVLFILVLWFAWTGSPTILTPAVGLAPVERVILVLVNIFIIGQDIFQILIDSVRLKEHDGGVSDYIIGLFSDSFFNKYWIPVGQAWTLSSELLFYLCAPLVVRSVPRILIVFATSITIRFVMIFGMGYSSENWGYHFFPAMLCLFLLGSLSYHIGMFFHRITQIRTIGIGFLIFYFVFSVVSVATKGGILFTTSYDHPELWLAYVVFALSLPFVFEVCRRWWIDREIGELSYPIYLVHGIMIGIVYNDIFMPQGKAGPVLIVVGFTVFLAACLHYGIERPVARLAQAHDNRLFRRGCFALAMVVSVLVCSKLAVMWSLPVGDAYDPPRLLQAVGKFNIVIYRDRFFAIPHGVPVDWNKDDLDHLPGAVVGPKLEDVVAKLPPN